MTELYEARLAAIFGAHCRAFSFWKGRVGFYAILKAMGLKENDEVVLPGYTCVVVPNAVRFVGAKPVYADIAAGGFNLDPASVEERVTSRTRALLIQHTYGIPADIDALGAIAKKHGLEIIEDCAHVLVGAKHKGKLLGSFGKAAFFSSQWSKPYTTGLGGMAVTRDEGLAERLMKIQATFHDPPLLQKLQLQIQHVLYSRFFKPELYWFSQKSLHTLSKYGMFVGSSNSSELDGDEPSDIRWRMSPFQQHAGITQIEKLQENSVHRQLLTKYYVDSLRRHDWASYDDWNYDAVKLLRFPLQVANKTKVLEESRRAHIEMGSWFETPLHPLPLAKHHLINYQLGSCPNAEATAKRVINLPVHRGVTQAQAEKIIRFVLSHASPASTTPSNSPLSRAPQNHCSVRGQ